MNEDYLWDRSGPPDPEIERLERLLAPLAHGASPVAAAPRPRPLRAFGAIAAIVLVALSIATLRPAAGPATGWEVAHIDGAARLGAAAARVAMPLRSGESLRTASKSEITLRADDVGRLDLGPDSEIHASGSRLQLHYGRLHAFIWAPPRRFVLDTPSARAVDLGCEYTLDVDPAGNGLLQVSAGWVAFQFDSRESFIPAGARCSTAKRSGPGLPYFDDASVPLAQAVAAFDRGDRDALPRILASARPRDALTLWHLLTRVPPPARAAVFDRFAGLVRLPPEISRDAALRLDPSAIDTCWNALNLESASWWRGWERPWRP